MNNRLSYFDLLSDDLKLIISLDNVDLAAYILLDRDDLYMKKYIIYKQNKFLYHVPIESTDIIFRHLSLFKNLDDKYGIKEYKLSIFNPNLYRKLSNLKDYVNYNIIYDLIYSKEIFNYRYNQLSDEIILILIEDLNKTFKDLFYGYLMNNIPKALKVLQTSNKKYVYDIKEFKNILKIAKNISNDMVDVIVSTDIERFSRTDLPSLHKIIYELDLPNQIKSYNILPLQLPEKEIFNMIALIMDKSQYHMVDYKYWIREDVDSFILSMIILSIVNNRLDILRWFKDKSDYFAEPLNYLEKEPIITILNSIRIGRVYDYEGKINKSTLDFLKDNGAKIKHEDYMKFMNPDTQFEDVYNDLIKNNQNIIKDEDINIEDDYSEYTNDKIDDLNIFEDEYEYEFLDENDD